MEQEEKSMWIIIISFFLFLVGMILLISLTAEDRQSSSEFCVKNGYAIAYKMNIDSGRCLKPHQSNINVPSNQYFGWDGTKWRFVED